MKDKIRGELMLALFFLVFFVGLTLISLTYSPKARRMPLVVGIPGVVLATVQVLRAASSKRGGQEPKEVSPGAEEVTLVTGLPGTDERKRLWAMIGWMALLVAMIWIFGFLVTIPVYTLLFMRAMKESWYMCLSFAIIGFAVLYLLFVVAINIELYPGLVFRL